MNLEKSAQFEQDLTGVVLSLVEFSPSTARRFLDAVDGAMLLLAKHPYIGPIWLYSKPGAPVRFLLVPGFRNYLIFYTVNDERLLAGRLMHGARDLQNILDEG